MNKEEKNIELWNRAYSSQDISAIADLYNQLKQDLYFSAYKLLRDKNKALDLLQDTFVSIIEDIKDRQRFKNVDNPMAFLYGFMRNVYRNRSRQEKNRKRILEDIAGSIERYELPTDQIDYQLLYDMIDKLKNQMYQKIIKLGIEGYSNKEIAKMLGRKEKGVRDAKYLAKRELKRILDKQGVDF